MVFQDVPSTIYPTGGPRWADRGLIPVSSRSFGNIDYMNLVETIDVGDEDDKGISSTSPLH
jgi:hypothetical protein